MVIRATPKSFPPKARGAPQLLQAASHHLHRRGLEKAMKGEVCILFSRHNSKAVMNYWSCDYWTKLPTPISKWNYLFLHQNVELLPIISGLSGFLFKSFPVYISNSLYVKLIDPDILNTTFTISPNVVNPCLSQSASRIRLLLHFTEQRRL